jgi:4-alpha-glucanotransferase
MREKFWFNDYALFQALNEKYGGEEWTSWEHDIAKRDPNAIVKATEDLKEHIEFHKFTQWCFDSQWKKNLMHSHTELRLLEISLFSLPNIVQMSGQIRKCSN